MRNELTIGLMAPAGSAAVEWRVSDALVPYETALAEMDARAAAIASGNAPELVWLLEHPPLYTAGTSADLKDVIDARFPVYEAGRGGQMNHGRQGGLCDARPESAGPTCVNLVTLEEWLIRTLAAFNVRGERRDDRIGVWVRRPEKGEGSEDKIAAIGIRVKQWVTLHGMALNVEPDLTHFSGIVPCGVSEQRYGVTSLVDLGLPVTMPEVDMILRREFKALFGAQTVGRTENKSPGARSLSSSSLPSR